MNDVQKALLQAKTRLARPDRWCADEYAKAADGDIVAVCAPAAVA